MKISTAEEFWEALDACKNFASEQKDDHAALFCVGGFGDRVGFLVAGNGSDIVSANCCALDNDDACRQIWSETSIHFARARSNVKVVSAETVGNFPVTPSKIKS